MNTLRNAPAIYPSEGRASTALISSLDTQEEVIKELRHLICRWEKQRGLLESYFATHSLYSTGNVPQETKGRRLQHERTARDHMLELYKEITFYIEWLRSDFGRELTDHMDSKGCLGCASIATNYTRLLVTEMLGKKENINLLMPVSS